MKNYFPVSNLLFLLGDRWKTGSFSALWTLVCKQLYSRFQSAYRSGHSTQTALLKIVNDLLFSLDDGNVSLIALLELSVAFNTKDRSIVLHRLVSEYKAPPYNGFHHTLQTALSLSVSTAALIRCFTKISPWTCTLSSLHNFSFDCHWKVICLSQLIRRWFSTPEIYGSSSNPRSHPLYAEVYWGRQNLDDGKQT